MVSMCTCNSVDTMKAVLHCIGILFLIPCSMVHAIFDSYRAHQLYQSGKNAEATAIFSALVAHNTKDWRSLYNLGSIALSDAQYEQAVAHFNKVLELQP